MFTVRETAQRLNCSISSVRSLITAGKMACHRIGLGRGCIRVSEAQLQAYLAQTAQELRHENAPVPLPQKTFKHLRVSPARANMPGSARDADRRWRASKDRDARAR